VFEEALTKVLSRLETARAQGLLGDYALIGGFAVAAWGVPRATQDIDFAVAIGSKDPYVLAEYMDGQYDIGGVDDPLKGVIRATVTVASGSVPLQLVFLPSVFTDAIFHQVETLSILNHRVPVVKWDVLLLLKLYAGGPQDMLDARQILKIRQPSTVEIQAVGNLAGRLGVLEEWTALSANYFKNQPPQ
jgi:hypothetical protein